MMPLKVQPLDAAATATATARTDPAKPAGKSLLKRLFERQLLKSSSTEKLVGDGNEKEEVETEPSSVNLDRMILSYIEENNNEKSSRCRRRRCNCFNGNCDDSSDDDSDFTDSPPVVSAAEILKGLIPCVSEAERNLQAEALKIVERVRKGKVNHRRDVADCLRTLGYDAALCKSKWDKTASFPAGEYEYVDVVVDGERILLDVEFRSEFEIARSTKSYRSVLQCLPSLFVGKADRLKLIVAVVSESARQSLKKKGLHYPPWRKPEYMRAKWLSAYQRLPTATAGDAHELNETNGEISVASSVASSVSLSSFSGEFNEGSVEEKVMPWQPPAVRPKTAAPARVIPGLSSVFCEKS